MLYNRSTSHNTRVSKIRQLGHIANHSNKGLRPGEYCYIPYLNGMISTGGNSGNLIQFQLEWAVDGDQAKRLVKEHKKSLEYAVYNPRTARTDDWTLNALPYHINATPNAAFHRKLRYYTVRNAHGGSISVGLGTFGIIYRAIDIDYGRLMAMKVLKWKHGTQLHIRVKTREAKWS